MTRSAVLLALLLLGLVTPEFSSAYTDEEIAVAARAATRVRTVRQLARRFGGRDNDTPESADVQQFLIRRLASVADGLDGFQDGAAAYRQPFDQGGVRGTNILGVIAGRELPAEYVVLGAHYDHLGTACRRVTPGDSICDGATDNASGVAVVLAIGLAIKRLPRPPRRSVVLAFWDAEEDGLVGSRYYVEHPIVPLDATVAYLNFDIQGGNLLPSLRNLSFAIGAETGGSVFQMHVDAAVSAQTVDVRQVSFLFGQLRSDYVNFANHRVPTVFFSDSTGPCYHTTDDDVSVVNFQKLRRQSQVAFLLAVELAETPSPPTFVPWGGVVYEDAVVVSDVFARGLADLGLFAPADQGALLALHERLAAIVRAGPAQFGPGDAATLLGSTIEGIGLIGNLECDGF